MLIAKCLKEIDPFNTARYKNLKINEYYKIKDIEIHNYTTSIYLEGNDLSYNSVVFEILDPNLEPFDIFQTGGPGETVEVYETTIFHDYY